MVPEKLSLSVLGKSLTFPKALKFGKGLKRVLFVNFKLFIELIFFITFNKSII